MHGQSKISPCCICDWCKSREMGDRESLRLPTPMVESFSADLLPAIKCYWTESPFELCISLGEQDTKLLYIMPLLQELGEEIEFFVYVQQKLSNKCKHEISDSLHYSIFFILFCYTKLRTDPHVNKNFFLFNFFFSKDTLSCSKVEATYV